MITNIPEDKVDIVIINNDDYKALIDDEVAFNEIVVSSATYRKTNKEVTSKKLSKILNTCNDSVERVIVTTTRHCIK